MRRFVFPSLVFAACIPLLLVGLLFAASQWTSMDKFTLAMPAGVRQAVAALALNNAGYGKDSTARVDRVIRLDPDSAPALSRRCELDGEDKPAVKLQDCRRAVRLVRSDGNLNGLGLAQEDLKNYCAAEESFTKANSRTNASKEYILRNLGRAALECGHAAAAVASFEVAEEHDAKDAEDEDDKDELTLDREWLVLANIANHDPKAAAAACTRAHPDWKGCDCSVDGGEVKCRDAK